GHAHVVVGQAREQALAGGVRLRFTGRRGGRPELPQRALAHQLAEIEPVAVETELEHRALAAMQQEIAAELGAAQLAIGVGKLELAVADAGIGGEDEIADRGLAGYVAVASGPAGERAQAGAFDLDRAGEYG